jgi:hypothetical protein
MTVAMNQFKRVAKPSSHRRINHWKRATSAAIANQRAVNETVGVV